VIEAGMPYLLAENFIGVSAPAQLPPAVVTKLHAAIQASLDDPTFGARMRDLGLTVRKMSQAEFADFVAKQVQGWAEPVKASGAKLN
jgi:tripartite-type tricarboxylate transporter receptor subunit TctC